MSSNDIKKKLLKSSTRKIEKPKDSINNYQSLKSSLPLLIKKIFCKFKRKYMNLPSKYEINIIDNIIYNDKSHIVAKFKDSLIELDYSDYLKRYYTKKESKIRLLKYFEYYNLYSKIFPNYTSIPEGKYFYINIQRKQRMIDLQEKIENENLKEKNESFQGNQNINSNVFNTSVVNSIINRTNKEEMEILFDIDFENFQKNENIFIEKINKLINLINSNEIKEDYYIDYNCESRNEKIKNKETISSLMNININYINFNKYNDDKTNSNSINNQSNKNIFFYKIIKMPAKENERKKKKINSKEKKDYSMLIMKVKKLKKNKRVLNNINKFKYLPIHQNNNIKNMHNNIFLNNQIYGTKKHRKNQTIVYDNRNNSLINNLIINKNNKSLKNLLSYKSSFGILSSINNNLDSFSKLSSKSPLTSRNKNRNKDINLYLSNKCYNNIISPKKENKSILSKKENKFFNLINNSRNKISLNSNLQSSRNNISSKKYNFIRNSISPSSKNIKLNERKKINQNYSFLNKTSFNKNKLINNIENNKNRNNVLFNNFIKGSQINKNSSLIVNRNYSNSIKGNKIHHSNSTKNIKYDINRQNFKGVYVNKFLKAFTNNSRISQKIISNTYREYKK